MFIWCEGIFKEYLWPFLLWPSNIHQEAWNLQRGGEQKPIYSWMTIKSACVQSPLAYRGNDFHAFHHRGRSVLMMCVQVFITEEMREEHRRWVQPRQKKIWKADSPSFYPPGIMREQQTSHFYLTFFSRLPPRHIFFEGTQTFSALKARGKEEEQADIVHLYLGGLQTTKMTDASCRAVIYSHIQHEANRH